MKKKILVTGGAGFIGANIVKKLVKLGCSVVVYDNCQRSKDLRRLSEIKNKIKIIKGDIRNLKKLNKSLAGIEMVIHLAYVNGTKFFYQRPNEIMDIAIRGMLNVIDACKNQGVRELILFSSSEVYGEPEIVPTPENIPLKISDIKNPRFSYGGGKICCELIFQYMCKDFFKKSFTIRPHNVYGPDMGYEHVIPEIITKIKKLKNKKSLMIQGSGNETRSFIFIDDFVNGFIKVMQKPKHLEIYNIGNNKEIKIKYLIKKLLIKLGKKNIKIITSKLKKGSPSKRRPNTSKIKKLGYISKIPLDIGLDKTINWYNN